MDSDTNIQQSTQLKFTSDIVCSARNAGDCVGAMLIDLEKACDTVWLDGLFYKLIKKNFSPYLIKILWNMLHDKQFQVNESNNISRSYKIENGLQQVNSPILIYISDLLQKYDPNSDGKKAIIAFADDM